MDCPQLPQKSRQYYYNLKYLSNTDNQDKKNDWMKKWKETNAHKMKVSKLKERRKGFSGNIAFEDREIHITFD